MTNIKRKIYIVGGAVRDSLMNKEPKDVDFVVTGYTIEEMIAKFGEPVGKDFPVFIGDIYGYKNVEIAMARKEVSTGPGYLDFEIVTGPDIDIETDLARRDITINAMAKDMDTGEIVDPFGGRNDLRNGIIKAVNNHTIVEDPVRILRIARFRARYGFVIDEKTKEIIIENKELLKSATHERVFLEMNKALKEVNAGLFFETLNELGVLEIIFPELIEEKFEKINKIKATPEIKFAIIFAGKIEKYSNRYRNLDRKYRKLAKIAEMIKQLDKTNIEKIYDIAIEAPKAGIDIDTLVLMHEKLNKTINKEAYERLMNAIRNITGNTLKNEGIKPGKNFGNILKKRRIDAAKNN